MEGREPGEIAPKIDQPGYLPDHTAERREKYRRTTPGQRIAEAIEASRFATRVANHVAQDVAAQGAPGAYALIWLCARRAFVQDANTKPHQPTA